MSPTYKTKISIFKFNDGTGTNNGNRKNILFHISIFCQIYMKIIDTHTYILFVFVHKIALLLMTYLYSTFHSM